jgi:hypothetical protein
VPGNLYHCSGFELYPTGDPFISTLFTPQLNFCVQE